MYTYKMRPLIKNVHFARLLCKLRSDSMIKNVHLKFEGLDQKCTHNWENTDFETFAGVLKSSKIYRKLSIQNIYYTNLIEQCKQGSYLHFGRKKPTLECRRRDQCR